MLGEFITGALYAKHYALASFRDDLEFLIDAMNEDKLNRGSP